MGSCYCTPNTVYDLSSLSSTNPSQWSQQQIILWLKHTANLCELIKPFKEHKIKGRVFASLTQEDLKQGLKITEFGLIKEFILLRDELLNEYEHRKLGTVSTTQSPSNTTDRSYTEEGSTKQMQHLVNQIQSNKDTLQKPLKAIDDERETSPLLASVPVIPVDILTLRKLNGNSDSTMHALKSYNAIDTEDAQHSDDFADEYDDFIEDNEYHEALVTDDDVYIVSSRTNATNLSMISNVDSDSNIASHQRMLAAYTHGWKVQNMIGGSDNEFITVNDLKWVKIRNQSSLDVLGINIDQTHMHIERNISDYYFMEQYTDNSYIGGCKLVIDGCIHALWLLVQHDYNYVQMSDISALVYAYLYEEEKAVYQFAYDTWKILVKINRKVMIDGEREDIKSFIGDSLVIEMRRKYWNKYRFGDICSYCNELLRYKYIELIAKREGASKVVDIDAFMNDSKYLYKFFKSKKRGFKKYHNFVCNGLDRCSWCRGTQVEIYSSSLHGWQLGEIVKIGTNHDVVVSYDGGNDSKYLLKTVKRTDVALVRSTRDFISNRNKWCIGKEIEIFSHSDELWYIASIEAIVPRDTETMVMDAFKVKYLKKSEGVYYTKRVDQWSQDCRDIQMITNEKLKMYKRAKLCQVRSQNTKLWEICNIKDIIPRHQYVVIQNLQSQTERIIDINSGSIRYYK